MMRVRPMVLLENAATGKLESGGPVFPTYNPIYNLNIRGAANGASPPIFGYGSTVSTDSIGSQEGRSIKVLTNPTQPGVTCGSHGFAGRFSLPEIIPEGKTVWLRVKMFFPSAFSFGYAYGSGAPSTPAGDGCGGASADGNPTGIKGLVFAPDVGTSRVYYNWSNSIRTINQSTGTGQMALEPDPGQSTGLYYAFPRDQWVTAEAAIKVANDDTGFFRVWADGSLIGEVLGCNTITGAATGIEEVGIGDYWNGTPWTDGAAGRNTFYVNEVLVATDQDGYGQPDAIDSFGNRMIGTTIRNRDF